jgi:hypothetical protein
MTILVNIQLTPIGDGNTREVNNRMFYTLAIQKGRVTADCFRLTRLLVYDGLITIYEINSNGTVIEECKGSIRGGTFTAEGSK